MQPSADELIVLLDDAWNSVGSAPKRQSHHRETPLHLAFTAYVFDDRRQLLLTRRALTKPTWPGVWTNSFCGHPAPGEPLERAVRRRSVVELGSGAERVDAVLGAVRYRAVMENGVVENEVGPAVRVLLSRAPDPNPAEVAGFRWVPWERVLWEVDRGLALSPWCLLTVGRLRGLGGDPWGWPVVADSSLPPALRGHGGQLP